MVEKLGHSAWSSTHLPGEVWDSEQAARFYDQQEERKKIAALERTQEELLSQYTPEQIKNLANAFSVAAAVNSKPELEYADGEVACFMRERPQCVNNLGNFQKLQSFLVGRNLYPPYSHAELIEAFDCLQPHGQLDLYKVQRNQQGRLFVDTSEGRKYLDQKTVRTEGFDDDAQSTQGWRPGEWR